MFSMLRDASTLDDEFDKFTEEVLIVVSVASMLRDELEYPTEVACNEDNKAL